MSTGKYQEKKAAGGLIAALWVVLLACIVLAVLLLLKSWGGKKEAAVVPEETVPAQTEAVQPESTEPETTEPETEPETTQPETTEPEPTETEPETTEPETEPETEPTEPVPQVDEKPVSEKIAETAKAMLGSPEKMGGTSPDGFDTTGLVYYCLKQSGVEAERFVAGQMSGGEPVKKEDIKAGDVVFFDLNEDGKADYPGIYLGDGKFAAVSSSRDKVAERTFEGYFESIFVAARRYN